jgi:hypothetical protein
VTSHSPCHHGNTPVADGSCAGGHVGPGLCAPSKPLSTVNQATCVNLNPQVKLNSENVCESGWIEIRRNNHVTKQLKKTSRCIKQLTPYIPLDDNRFSRLNNLHDQAHHPTYGQDKSQPTHLSKISGKNRRKVILLGDVGVLTNWQIFWEILTV